MKVLPVEKDGAFLLPTFNLTITVSFFSNGDMLEDHRFHLVAG